MQKKRKFDKTAFVFIAPAFIFFTLFIIVPTVSSVYYSFTSWDGVSPNVKFIGLANYKEIFTSARFGNALKNTILLTVFISVFENAFALALALIVDNVRWGKNFFRSAFYVPVLVSGIVSGFIWKIMYNYNFGTINTILKDIGMGDFRQDWLGNNKLTLIMIGVVLVWKGAGYYMIIYLASLQSVSPDLIEAAQIDGATSSQTFWKITIPLIKPIMSYVLVTSLIGGLQMYDVPALLTKDMGSPNGKLKTVVMIIQANKQGDIGKASALCVIIFIVSAIIGLALMFASADHDGKKKKKKRG